MAKHSPLRRTRHAFTLVEMLTVIIIIGILASLMLVAFQAARTRARVATIKTEISQLDTALESYQQQYGEYPPDFSGVGHPTKSVRDDGRQRVLRHLRKRFPRYQLAGSIDAQWIAFGTAVWNATRTAPYPDFPSSDPGGDPNVSGRGLYVTEFDPRAAIVFWLGGLPLSFGSAELTGVSANVSAPFTKGGSRTPRLFEFNVERVGYATPNFGPLLAVPQYNGQSVPIYGSYSVNAFAGATYPSGSLTKATPYIYFRGSTTTGYVTIYDVLPYTDSRRSDYVSGPVVWVQPERFQIISAGLDGGFGSVSGSTSAGAHYPTGENFSTPDPDPNGVGSHLDNITNFTVNGTIKDDMP